MRIVICDYGGYSFPVQLSRELARRSHSVLHLYFADVQGPKGRLQLETNDPETLTITGVSLRTPFLKHSFFRRRFQEIQVGRHFAKKLSAFAPDLVMGSNLSLDSLMEVLRSCQEARIPFVFWLQDIYSVAVSRILGQKFGLLGRAAGKFYYRLEARALAMSSAIIVIADDFSATLVNDFGVAREKIHVIENWAPLDELRPQPKVNPWSQSHGLVNSKVVLYAGTLGRKHDPGLILGCAEALRTDRKAVVVVVSEGPAAAWLEREAKKAGCKNLLTLPFQAIEEYPDVLSAADVLIAILSQDAGSFSVPSKILSYLCAGRPIVLSAPFENLAARIINKSKSGTVVPAGNRAAFAQAVRDLLENADLREVACNNARAYAEQTFEIKPIADRFEKILSTTIASQKAV